MSWRNALNKAYEFTGLPAAYCVWETLKDYLFLMVPEDTPLNAKIEIGATLIAVSKSSNQAYPYVLFDHREEFTNAKLIYSADGGLEG